jgi:hypothetical protein
MSYDIVTCNPLLPNDLVNPFQGKHARNNRTTIARQRRSKHSFLTIEVVSCVVCAKLYIEVFISRVSSEVWGMVVRR